MAHLPLTGYLLLATLFSIIIAKSAPPVALEAAYKDRITAKLAASVDAAALHLVSRLGEGGGAFGGYELELGENDGDKPVWQNSCTGRWMNATKDSVENCAMRQLQALTAICDVPAFFDRSEASLAVVRNHLKALSREEVPGLGLKRKKFDGVDIWFYRKTPDGSPDDVDASPALQASVLMAMVRCADATGDRHYFQEAESWFEGLAKVYPSKQWDENRVNFHRSSIIWESLALVASHLPRDSDFSEKLQDYVKSFEQFLNKAWEETPSSWSFASARALAIRWHSGSVKSKKGKQFLRKWAIDHVDRFLGRQKKSAKAVSDGPDASKESVSEGILAKIGSVGYTCGPLQGLASLAGILADAELVQAVLQLMEKDIERYQISTTNAGFSESLALVSKEVVGTFFRDAQQMKMEQRKSIRVDDPAQCVIAISQALRTLDGIVAVEMDAADVAAAQGREEPASGAGVDGGEL